MTDNVENLILEPLRALRAGQDRLESELREVGARLTSRKPAPPRGAAIALTTSKTSFGSRRVSTRSKHELTASNDGWKSWVEAQISHGEFRHEKPSLAPFASSFSYFFLILDNASVHKAKAIQPILNLLEKRGLKLYFLPPYSPELNRIEKLWHKIKYEWMAFQARDAKTLEADVDEILAGFGTDYRLTFC